MKSYITLLRIPQYSKNFFVFLPPFFALHLFETARLFKVSLAFIGLCFIASAVYIFNDLCDLAEDRKHPKKKHRSLPAGTITRSSAIGLMGCLLVFGLVIAYNISWHMLFLSIFYIVLNIAYSIKLKHVPIMDVIVIAVGFVIRIFMGGSAGDVPIYMWIVIMTFLLALFMALGKRRDDLLIYIKTSNMPRESIKGYNLRFIDATMIIMATVVLVAYLMYTISPEITTKFKTDKLYITSVFVLMGVMRYLQITMLEEGSGDPTEILLNDRFIMISIAGWITSFAFLIYLR